MYSMILDRRIPYFTLLVLYKKVALPKITIIVYNRLVESEDFHLELTVKKVYCPSCKQLVRARDQAGKGKAVQVLCTKCDRLLYIWNSVSWQFVPQSNQS